MVKTIKASLILNATPKEIYDTLMDAKKHAKLIGSSAKIENKVGGEFCIYDCYIVGTNLKLEKDKKIVQKWTCTDFPEGYYAEVTFELKKKGKDTEIVFTQKDVPDKNYESLKKGWEQFYWEPLRKMFNEK